MLYYCVFVHSFLVGGAIHKKVTDAIMKITCLYIDLTKEGKIRHSGDLFVYCL